jgi:hypothetical protein
MKPLLIAALLASTAAWSQAQVAAPANKPAADINPFTGKPLSVEQIQRELELSRLRTQMLEEQLKQTNIQEEMTALPLRKAVETSQARTAAKKEENAMFELDMRLKEMQKERQRAIEEEAAKKRAAKQAEERKAAAAAAAQAVQVRPAPQPVIPVEPPKPKLELLSVMQVGASASILLSVNGDLISIKDGEQTPWGDVDIVNEREVRIGSETFTVHGQTVSRFAVNKEEPSKGFAAPPPPPPPPFNTPHRRLSTPPSRRRCKAPPSRALRQISKPSSCPRYSCPRE